MMDADGLDVDGALLALRQRGMLRESQINEPMLLALHALAAAGEVQVDWGMGGWQFFITSSRMSRPESAT